MNFDNIFKPDAADAGRPLQARDPLEKEQEIERLKKCLLNLNSYAGTTKAHTLKALDAGRPLEEIFLELCEGVSLMTGEPLFLKAVKSKFNEYKPEKQIKVL